MKNNMQKQLLLRELQKTTDPKIREEILKEIETIESIDLPEDWGKVFGKDF